MTLNIERWGSEGVAIAHNDGKTVLVSGVIPGETVRVAISETHASWDRAEVISLLESSPLRRNPPCSLYASCGGCDLQIIDIQTQTAMKMELFASLLTRAGSVPPDGVHLVPSPEWGYRNRIQLHSDGKTRGFLPRKGHDIVPVDDCPVCHSSLNDWLAVTGEVPPGRHTVFGSSEGVYPSWVDIPGRVRVRGGEFTFPSSGFFQSNVSALEGLLGWLDSFPVPDSAVDLYAGCGLFSVYAHTRGVQRISGIESSPGIRSWYESNLSRAGSTGFSFKGGTVEDGIGRMRGQKPGLVILDPPRTGCSRKALEGLILLAPRSLWYVSCNPQTQMRDIAILKGAGYRVIAAALADFYPQTHHMETCLILERLT